MQYLPSPSAFAYLEESRRDPRYFLVMLANYPLYLLLFLLIPYTLASIVVVPLVITSWNATKTTNQFSLTPEIPVETSESLTPTPIPPTPTPVPPNLVPVEIEIPTINVSTTVEHVGQTRSLNMDVPKNAANVAWYVYGAKPGEVGNAVINGHYDTPSGRPAVFYNLRKLVEGDELIVTSEDGTRSTFVVTGKEVHNYESFPNEYVFHTKPGTNLNIITCDGIWDQVDKIYDKRLVIYTTLKEHE